MSSPFKMAPKTPFMKALVGKQGNLPQHLQDAIKAAPAKSTKKPMTAEEIKKNKEILDYRRGKGRIKESGGDINARGINKGRGLEGEAKVAGSAGTRGVKEDYTASGKSMGTSGRVVKEKTASKIKKRGVKKTNIKASAGKSPAKMKGVKALKKKK